MPKRLGESISQAVRHPMASIKKVHQEKEMFWALRNISLNIEQGASIGIIGRNGAGKSTLLKILSQITYPTEGEVIIRGRVGSLLEVGTGFHPDLTGRENIYLNGAILGMTKKEIDSKFDQIVKFAEIEKFLDTQTKRYSSGMYLRLAFSVAAHLEPDVLIADEVLAVGDQQFQNKCIGRMKEVSNEGRTLVFVSHNMHAIRALCRSAVYLDKGMIVSTGDCEDVIREYASKNLDAQTDIFPVHGQGIDVESMVIRQNGKETSLIDGSYPFEIELGFSLSQSFQRLRMGIHISNSIGDELVRSYFSDWDVRKESLDIGRYVAHLEFPEKLMVSGDYNIKLAAKRQGDKNMFESTPVEKLINVSIPVDFNSGGSIDPLQSEIILDSQWEITKY